MYFAYRQQQMASSLAQTVETTLLRTAQQGIMSAEDDVVVIKTDRKQHVALRGMAARCTQATVLAQKFREEHPDLKLINHLVIVVFYLFYCKGCMFYFYFFVNLHRM